ncbi:transcriptional regulator [Sporothrix stenoceras]|uniref:Transcriptional regulator n=1 Tax=Sporothrix stenoceras TaxID=5173 RepID=A0ABR3ZPM4_9PEZI
MAGGVPHSLRGVPNGFNAQQQQPPQQARSVSSRLPNGKMGGGNNSSSNNNNASGWAFGSGVPLAGSGGGGGGGAGLGGGAAGGNGLQQNQGRPQQQMGGNISFAQSLGGSQPATPLDLSEFPSLSSGSQLANAGQASLWSTAGSRSIGGGQAIQRGANTPQQQGGQQEDMFGASAARLQQQQQQQQQQQSNQGSFRFGSQTASIGQANIGQQSSIGQASIGQQQQQQQQAAQSSQPGSIDDFPPLNRSANAGEIGQDRTASLMSSLGYGSQASATSPAPPGIGGTAGAGGASAARGMGNGLLNALSANSGSRVASGGSSGAPGGEVRSPVGTRPAQETTRSLAVEEEAAAARQKQQESDAASAAAAASAAQSPIGEADGRSSIGAIGGGGDAAGNLREESEAAANASQDPLAGTAPIDRWGMKGLRTLLNNPEYSAMISGWGLDLNTLGVDLNSNDLLSTQTYSLFDGVAPRPAVPKFRLPECYKVSNVGPIESKISSFNEETLMWIFYSCPNDVKQQLAANELNNRNWRWHKRQQVWLTKDDLMMPQVLSMNHERGFYIVWDTTTWRKERTTREITLNYGDLDNSPVATGGAV